MEVFIIIQILLKALKDTLLPNTNDENMNKENEKK